MDLDKKEAKLVDNTTTNKHLTYGRTEVKSGIYYNPIDVKHHLKRMKINTKTNPIQSRPQKPFKGGFSLEKKKDNIEFEL